MSVPTSPPASTSPLSSADDDRLPALRAELPAVERRTYLNTGTCGPLPRGAAAALGREIEHELDQGRADLADFERVFATLAELRGRFACLVGADADEMAITHHTSDGINIVLWGLNWQPGDEVLLTTLEHEGALVPAYAMARRFGVDVRVADLGLGGDPAAVLAAFDRALTPRTRLVVVSHVAWNTGAVLPLADIARLAHARGALVLVDGAQSVGAIAIDVHALDVDFYTVSGQKWLCGPEGVGALYVRRDRTTLVRQTFASYLSLRDIESWTLQGDFLPALGARRFELATVFRPGLHAMVASLRFLDETVGLPWAWARIAALAEHARALLAALPGAQVFTPAAHAGLVAFTLPAIEGDPAAAEALVRALARDGIIVRTVPLAGRTVLRVSTGFYNTAAELERLRDALAAGT